MSENPYYRVCARHKDGGCKGRITWEHALIYAGKQVQEEFAIIPICEYHHAVDNYQDGGDLNKEKNHWIALNRIGDEEILERYPKSDWIQRKKYLNKKYGAENKQSE